MWLYIWLYVAIYGYIYGYLWLYAARQPRGLCFRCVADPENGLGSPGDWANSRSARGYNWGDLQSLLDRTRGGPALDPPVN